MRCTSAREIIEFGRDAQYTATLPWGPKVDPLAAVGHSLSGISKQIAALAGLKVDVCVGRRGTDSIVPVKKPGVEAVSAAGADVFVMPALGPGNQTEEGTICRQ